MAIGGFVGAGAEAGAGPPAGARAGAGLPLPSRGQEDEIADEVRSQNADTRSQNSRHGLGRMDEG